jgi:hypothetical protein
MKMKAILLILLKVVLPVPDLGLSFSLQDSSSNSYGRKYLGFGIYFGLDRYINTSDAYGLCGAFVVNNTNFSNPCVCLNGFKPFSIEETSLRDWSGGCVRKSPLQCMNNTYANGKKDWFMKIPILRFHDNSKAMTAMNCEAACMNDCSCTAYAYNSSGYCMIWEGALLNLQQPTDGVKAGQDIYLRLAADEYRADDEYQSTKSRMNKMKSTQIYVISLSE